MEKRVLVMPNWGQMTEQVNGMPAEDALKKYSSGNLLASFGAEVIDCGSMGKAIGVTDEDMEPLEGGKKYHILILEGK